MTNMDNYPIGAANDPNIPYNEPSNVKHKRFVSASISYYDTVELPADSSDEQIDEAFRQKVSDGIFPKEFDIDELIILKE